MSLSFTITAGLASAVILGTESRGTHDHISLSQVRVSPNLEDQGPYSYPPEHGGTAMAPDTVSRYMHFPTIVSLCSVP
jgi:hypothetical protein